MWLIELGFRNHLILKGYRFLTTAIFIGSDSTVLRSLKIMFQKLRFLVLFRL